jgi:hypothetical protein
MNLLQIIFSALLSSGILGTLFYFILKKMISNHFDKKLAEHKQSLDILTEQKKAEFQKQIHDFTLYNTKKHEIYSELYKLLLIAFGYSSSLVGFRTMPDYSEYSASDLKKALEEKQLLGSKIDEFVTLLQKDPSLADKEIKSYLKIIEPQIATSKYNDAKNFYLLNELYLDEGISNVVEQTLDEISRFIDDIESRFQFGEKPEVNFSDRKRKIDTKLKELKKLMRYELSKSV